MKQKRRRETTLQESCSLSTTCGAQLHTEVTIALALRLRAVASIRRPPLHPHYLHFLCFGNACVCVERVAQAL